MLFTRNGLAEYFGGTHGDAKSALERLLGALGPAADAASPYGLRGGSGRLYSFTLRQILEAGCPVPAGSGAELLAKFQSDNDDTYRAIATLRARGLVQAGVAWMEIVRVATREVVAIVN